MYKRFISIILFIYCLAISGCGGGSSANDINGTPVANTFSNSCIIEDYPDAATSTYILPYPVDEQFNVVKGNCAQFGHNIGEFGDLRYTYDFAMPLGTEILAARAGVVVSIVESFTDGNATPLEANYVSIQHEDGTFAQYVHIAENSVPLTIGQNVAQGMVIALSGDSGVTSAPKLHFEVINSPFEGCVPTEEIGDCQSIPVTFKNADPQTGALIEDQIYNALPF